MNKERLRGLLVKLNYLPIFDPSLLPERELLGRATGLSICAAFIIHRALRFTDYTGDMPFFIKNWRSILDGSVSLTSISLTSVDLHWFMWSFIWIIETAIFTGYILAFISRNEARSVAKGFMETVFPVMIAAIPIVITLTPMNFRDIWPPFIELIKPWLPNAIHLIINWEVLFMKLLIIIILGGVINLTGLLTLRKAFTIMAEARIFIHTGIFSYIRHPLYTGHFIMFFGYLMFHLYWYTCLLYVLFVVGQYLRARIEEQKLENAFPEYIKYRKNTGMFLPKIKFLRG